MGWSYSKRPLAELIESLTRPESWVGSDGKRRWIETHAQAVVRDPNHSGGQVLWAVQSRFTMDDAPGVRSIVCYLLEGGDNSSGYKDIPEIAHPYYYSCPVEFLGLAPEQCAEWRDGVRQFHAARAAEAKPELVPEPEPEPTPAPSAARRTRRPKEPLSLFTPVRFDRKSKHFAPAKLAKFIARADRSSRFDFLQTSGGWITDHKFMLRADHERDREAIAKQAAKRTWEPGRVLDSERIEAVIPHVLQIDFTSPITPIGEDTGNGYLLVGEADFAPELAKTACVNAVYWDTIANRFPNAEAFFCKDWRGVSYRSRPIVFAVPEHGEYRIVGIVMPVELQPYEYRVCVADELATA